MLSRMSKLNECTGVGLKGKTYNFANFNIRNDEGNIKKSFKR